MRNNTRTNRLEVTRVLFLLLLIDWAKLTSPSSNDVFLLLVCLSSPMNHIESTSSTSAKGADLMLSTFTCTDVDSSLSHLFVRLRFSNEHVYPRGALFRLDSTYHFFFGRHGRRVLRFGCALAGFCYIWHNITGGRLFCFCTFTR